MNIISVCNEELKGGMQGYSLCLLGSNCSRSDVNVRAQLLRKNYSRNLSSIRSGPQIYIYKSEWKPYICPIRWRNQLRNSTLIEHGFYSICLNNILFDKSHDML